MRILHLIDLLDSSDCTRQLHLLSAQGTDVCCLGPDSPRAQTLRDAGVAVHALQWTRWIDPGVVGKLRRVLREVRPDVIHVWRLAALRLLALAAPEWLPRVVLSGPLPPGKELAWWDRWLLRQVRCVALASVREKDRCLSEGIASLALRVVSPAVVDCEDAASSESERTSAGAIVCPSPLEREFGVRNAIWAFDIVRCLYSESRLLISGAGSQEPNLRSLALGLQNDAVHFVGKGGPQTADLVWIPSIADCGAPIALDALARGCAVIASDVPSLRELIDDGVTGFLVSPGDVVALGRRTRLFFSDQTLRERLGNAGRQAVRQRFPLGDALERWREVYRLAAA